MAKIQTFGTKTRLKNNEILTFGREVESTIEAKGAAELVVDDLFPDYKDKLQSFDDSIVNVAKSFYTNQMNEANKQRGSLHVAIIAQIKNFLRHFKPEKRSAAERLTAFTDTFVGAQRRSFDDQTSFINNFLQELSSDKYKEDVTLVELDEWIKELQKVNDLCPSLTIKRTEEYSQKPGKGSTEVTRPLFEKSYNLLVEKLNALAIVNGDDKYAELFAWWNARIDHYRVVISNNLGKGMGGKTSTGTTHPSTPGKGEGEDDRPVIE